MEINENLAKKVLEVVDVGLCAGIGNPVPGQMCVEAAVCFAMGLPHGDDPGCVSGAVRALKIILNEAQWSSDQTRAKGLRRLAIAQLGSKEVIDNVVFAKHVSMLAKKYALSAMRAKYAEYAEYAKYAKYAKYAEYAEYAEYAAKYAAEYAEYAEYAAKYAAEYAAKSAEYAAKYAAEYAAESAKYAAKYAAEYAAKSAEYAAESAAESAKYAAKYAAEYAAKSAEYAAESAAESAKYAAESDKVLADFAEDTVQILIQMNAPGCVFLGLTEG